MWMIEVFSDGFEMVVMLSAERGRDVMQCNAMMGAWGEERSVVGAWTSAGWVKLALVDARVAPLLFSPGPAPRW